MPERVAAAGFRAAADVAVRRQSKGVRRLRVNLRRVVGPQYPEPEFDALVKSAMRSYGRYWLETFRLPTMDLDEVTARVQANTEGIEHIDRAMAAGRGLILALPHMGNWDVAAIWLIKHGVPFTTVAERLRPESLYDRFVAYREGIGMRVVALTGGPRPAAEILAARLRKRRVRMPRRRPRPVALRSERRVLRGDGADARWTGSVGGHDRRDPTAGRPVVHR